MDSKKVSEAVRKVTEARMVLVRDYPFFGHLSMGLQPACAPCGTACTDGSRLIFDPDFAAGLTDREMQFVILHEVLHCALNHCIRGKGLHSLLYNVACDIVVNSTILDMWGMDAFMITGEEVMHLAPDGREGCFCSAEEVYHMLLSKKIEYSFAFDRHDLWQGICDQTLLKDTWSGRIKDAVRNCKDSAEMPQSIREVIRSLTNCTGPDWKQLLHDFIQHDRYDYTFLPPDRRYLSTDFFLPACNVDEDRGSASDIWVCVDTSASISDEDLSRVMAEILDAMKQAELKGSISFFDSGITEPAPFNTEGDLTEIVPIGGGGTSFQIIFDYLKEKLYSDPPRAILIFTDGYAAWPKESDALGIPVLWMISKGGRANAPWGRVLQQFF